MWCCESADFLQLTKASNYFRSFFLIGGFGCTRWIIAFEGLNSGRRSLGKIQICAQTGESYSVSAEGFFLRPDDGDFSILKILLRLRDIIFIVCLDWLLLV